MTTNVKLIYELIRTDLKAEGWRDEAIAEAIAECLKERQTTGADDKTLCVKEMSYLSPSSLQKVTSQIDNNKSQSNHFIRIKDTIIKLVKGFNNRNLEAKIGILFLILPIIVTIIYILIEILGNQDGKLSAIPITLGLMVLAGAYLIKGNLK